MSGAPFYITTAISYPNGRPHIGHAYEAIVTDAIARFHRLSGRDVRFQTGTDEHGLKMVQTARDKGVTVQHLCKDMSDQFQAMCDTLNISYDRFIRTTEPAHHTACQAIWTALAANGDLELGRYEGWYSVRDEAFYDEKDLIDGADGVKLSPEGTPVDWTVEENWRFKLSAYQDKLLAHYAANPDFIQPESRRNEVIRFVESGLRDLSVSRTSFDWGVKVPGSPDHVMYVWLDALTNYLTGLGYPLQTTDLNRFWPANLHVIGKDVVRFHAVYWPAFLMSANLPLPKTVFGHGHVLARGGEKMSKSLGNVVDPMVLAERYGVDALRYFLLREVSFGGDGSYSAEAIVTRCNADLANGLGNLAQRCLSVIAKNCGGEVPTPGQFNDDDNRLLHQINALEKVLHTSFEHLNINAALESIWAVVGDANAYFANQAPWALRKTDPLRADTVLYCTAEVIRCLAILSSWAIPAGAERLLDLLGQAGDIRMTDLQNQLQYGLMLSVPEGVFPRLELSADDAK